MCRFQPDSVDWLVHGNTGRPKPWALSTEARQQVLQLAQTRYAGFNYPHLRQKLVEQEGFCLSRETLRRLLREAGLASPQKRRSRLYRARRPRRSCLGLMASNSTKPPTPPDISARSTKWSLNTACRSPSIATVTASFSATIHTGRWPKNSPDGSSQPRSDARSRNSESSRSRLIHPKPRAASNVSGEPFRTASPANCASPAPPPASRPISSSIASSRTSIAVSLSRPNRPIHELAQPKPAIRSSAQKRKPKPLIYSYSGHPAIAATP